MQGCSEKGMQKVDSQKLWDTFEYFSGYGFNKSHAVSYSILSFQCAWLMNYYPVEWMASFLDKEPEKRKEKAINIAKQNGFEIVEADINTSSFVWEIDPNNDINVTNPQCLDNLTSFQRINFRMKIANSFWMTFF